MLEGREEHRHGADKRVMIDITDLLHLRTEYLKGRAVGAKYWEDISAVIGPEHATGALAIAEGAADPASLVGFDHGEQDLRVGRERARTSATEIDKLASSVRNAEPPSGRVT